MSLEELRKRILEEAQREAEEILRKAREEAERIIAEAKEEYYRRLRNARRKALQEFTEKKNAEYVSKLMELNTELLKLKNRILNEILADVRRELVELPASKRKESLKTLLKESIGSNVFTGNVIVKVVPNDSDIIKEVVQEYFKDVVTAVELCDPRRLGGVLVESLDREHAIDNTYTTRLEKAMPEIMNMLNTKIFQSGRVIQK